MMNVIPLYRPPLAHPFMRSLAVAAALIALGVAAGRAFAGECPADKRVPDGQGQKAGPMAPVGVTDVVRASTDLSKEPASIKGRQFRLRQLEMQPGGIVPWHSHNDRPAMIYIVSGEVVEYASSCAVPIMHRAGDVAPEKNGTSHWWKNTGSTPAVLISVDLFPGEAHMDEHVM
ncbi:MAG TPA: cupin domain-containing protein [Burkholderiaceae bacterium]|nr:cupin domain-containing protein [Burkholderiaceae bacterium]